MTEESLRASASELLDLMETSRPLPLLRSQLRVRKERVYDLVNQMRLALGARDGAGEARPLFDAAVKVEGAVHHAQPVPLTDDVRLARERVAELIRTLRAAGA